MSPDQQPKPVRRIHSLDGLRAMAASFVVLAHMAFQHHVTGFDFLGPLGVYLFFVLSGYLITTLLLQEQRRTGTLSLRKFWLRRAARILPAYFCYVAVMGLLSAFAPGLRLSPVSFLRALTFTTGWGQHDWELGHLWTLAVETQFYLLWPIVMLACTARWRWVIGLSLMLGGMVARIGIYHWMGPDYMRASPANLDSVIAGCLLALLLESSGPRLQQTWQKYRLIALPAAAIAGGLTVFLTVSERLGVLTVPLGNTVLAAGFALLVLEILLRETGVVHAVLNSRGLVWVGTLSYSIYLWQQVVLRPGGLASPLGAGRWLDQPFVSIGLIALLAAASYYGLERPFLNVRRKLH